MPETPNLFGAAPAPPTTRTVARWVRDGGAAALADAVRRADNARYQEVTCRSALNRVEGMPFRWTLNPYRGCTHGCHYCFARRFHPQFDLGPGDDFSSVILVKVNFAEVLRRELERPSWKKGLVAFGTATDPYQPIEGHYKITRRSLEALAAHPTPVGLVTKGPMAVRDCDILADLSRRTQCTVYFSVPTVDEDDWRLLEPGTAHPLQRLRAVRTLSDAGVNAGVLMSPIVPGITSHPAKLQRTVRAMRRPPCRPRRLFHGRQSAAPRGWHPDTLPGVPVTRVSSSQRQVRQPVCWQVCAEVVRGPGPRDSGRAETALLGPPTSDEGCSGREFGRPSGRGASTRTGTSPLAPVMDALAAPARSREAGVADR